VQLSAAAIFWGYFEHCQMIQIKKYLGGLSKIIPLSKSLKHVKFRSNFSTLTQSTGELNAQKRYFYPTVHCMIFRITN